MACQTINLKGFGNNCDTSMGGVKAIWIANYAEGRMTTISASSGTDEGKLNWVSTSAVKDDFKVFYIKQNTSSFTSTLTVDPANGVNFVSTVLSLVFTKMDTEKRIEMSALAVSDVNVIVCDANNKYWYLGFDEPVTATNATGETGVQKTDGNRYTIEFTDESTSFPYELSADAIAELPTE